MYVSHLARCLVPLQALNKYLLNLTQSSPSPSVLGFFSDFDPREPHACCWGLMWPLWLPAQAEKTWEEDTPWTRGREFPGTLTGVSTLRQQRRRALRLSGKRTAGSFPPGHTTDNNRHPDYVDLWKSLNRANRPFTVLQLQSTYTSVVVYQLTITCNSVSQAGRYQTTLLHIRD